MKKPVSYGSYLQLDALLALQKPVLKPEHLDEMQFIIVHQAFELWFKLVLHEVDEVFKALGRNDAPGAARLMRRITQIERLWINQIHILETMSPADFLRFRAHLTPASGLQSFQFRELEYAAGLRDSRYIDLFASNPTAVRRLKRRMAAPSLWEAFLAALKRAGMDVSDRKRFATLRALYLQPKREAWRDLAEALIEFDEYLALWRAHHIHMVARVIGGKPGTGYRLVKGTLKGGEAMGTQGVDYLQTTLSKKCFPELWEMRTQLEAP